MKTHPILFSTPMVQAILDGRKTMTRRIIKPQQPSSFMYGEKKQNDCTWYVNFPSIIKPVKCPYGKPGDVLWVRETFAPALGDYAYMADYAKVVLNLPENKGLWKPSIHMPKAACRIFLKITDIKVERLQDITREECKKEGVLLGIDNGKFAGWHDIFRDLWENINGPDSWQSNPWIWVIAFERCEKPENFLTS